MIAKPTMQHEPKGKEFGLTEIGLTEEDLLQTAPRWYLSWAGFTPIHAPIGIGILAWAEAITALRHRLLPKAWR